MIFGSAKGDTHFTPTSRRVPDLGPNAPTFRGRCRRANENPCNPWTGALVSITSACSNSFPLRCGKSNPSATPSPQSHRPDPTGGLVVDGARFVKGNHVSRSMSLFRVITVRLWSSSTPVTARTDCFAPPRPARAGRGPRYRSARRRRRAGPRAIARSSASLRGRCAAPACRGARGSSTRARPSLRTIRPSG